MGHLSRFNPTIGIKDFWTEFSRPQPYRWPILGLSVFMTFCLFYWITQEEAVGLPPSPEVTYITSFRPDRTDAEIIASNIANQQRQDALAAAAEARAELRRDLYRSLGRATGIDVDEMEREIAAERARDQRAERAKREKMLGRPVAPMLETRAQETGIRETGTQETRAHKTGAQENTPRSGNSAIAE